MSLMYEALRPKSSAECSPGFSALQSQMASVRYVEKLNLIPNSSILRRNIMTWLLSAGALAVLIAICVLIVTREGRAPDASKIGSVSIAEKSTQSMPAVVVAGTSAPREQTNQRNQTIAVALNPPPQYILLPTQNNKPSASEKNARSTSYISEKKVVEEKIGVEKNSSSTHKNLPKQSVEEPKNALIIKRAELITNPESSLKASEKEPVVTNPVQATTQPIDALNLADHFDAMNRELSKGAKSQASTHLKAIQAALTPTSISRLRAEAWYEYHAGNLEASKAIYRKILNRAPGDDNATSVLQAIEIKSGGSSASK